MDDEGKDERAWCEQSLGGVWTDAGCASVTNQPGPWRNPNMAEWRCPECAQTVWVGKHVTRLACSGCDVEMERLFPMEGPVNQWVVIVKDPNGNRKRTRVTSVVVDREPTLEEIRATIGDVARLLVDDLYVQEHSRGLSNRALNELHGHMEDAAT